MAKTLVGIRLRSDGLKISPDFPDSSYESTRNQVASKLQNPSHLLDQFLGAWNAVLYRFLACAEHDDQFIVSIQRAGNSPQTVERYNQERELFNFFVNGLATIESLCYGLFAIGSALDVAKFPITSTEDMQAINPQKTAKQFQAAYPSEKLSVAIKAVVDSNEYKEWKDIRNVLAHRSAPGRIFHASSGGRGDDTFWKLNNVRIDENTTATRRVWLASSVGKVLSEAEDFSKKYF